MVRNRYFFVAAVALCCALALSVSFYRVGTTIPAMGMPAMFPVIVIDPGHGGVDGGAVGINNEIEKDINLAISLKLRDMLDICGFEVVMTRDTDRSIHDADVTGTKKQKTSDLHNRLAIIQENPNTIAISIHQNKFGKSSSWGTQIFYGGKNPESQRLAEVMQQRIVELLQPENTRQTKKAGKNLFLMYESECPAILVECGFLSNKNDVANLSSDEYQSKMAFAILYSLLDYFQMEVPPAVVPEPADSQ